MARQKKIVVTGSIKNLIFYEHRGIECVRTKPAKVRQTKATKLSAGQFGKAAQISRALREGLDPLLHNSKERGLMYRLNDALLQWLLYNNTEKITPSTCPVFIKDHQFYEKTSLSERVKVPLTVTWTKKREVLLDIPALIPVRHVSAPAKTKMVRLEIGITGCLLKDFSVTGNYVTGIEIPYNTTELPAQQIKLPFVMKPGILTVVAVALKNGVKNKGSLPGKFNDNWEPAGIVGACFK